MVVFQDDRGVVAAEGKYVKLVWMKKTMIKVSNPILWIRVSSAACRRSIILHFLQGIIWYFKTFISSLEASLTALAMSKQATGRDGVQRIE